MVFENKEGKCNMNIGVYDQIDRFRVRWKVIFLNIMNYCSKILSSVNL